MASARDARLLAMATTVAKIGTVVHRSNHGTEYVEVRLPANVWNGLVDAMTQHEAMSNQPEQAP